jgi:hypothetical protein
MEISIFLKQYDTAIQATIATNLIVVTELENTENIIWWYLL